MKAGRCAVYIQNMKGDFYLVDLTEDEEHWILELIGKMHGGKVKAHGGKQPLVRVKINPLNEKEYDKTT